MIGKKPLIDIWWEPDPQAGEAALEAAALFAKLVIDMLGMALLRMRKATLLPNKVRQGWIRLKSGMTLAQPNFKKGEAHV